MFFFSTNICSYLFDENRIFLTCGISAQLSQVAYDESIEFYTCRNFTKIPEKFDDFSLKIIKVRIK